MIDITQTDEPRKAPSKGTYKVLTVTFKNEEGKIDAKKLYDFACPSELWHTFSNATKGNVFNIERNKNEKGFWDWIGIHRQDGPMKVTEKAHPVPTKPTYETPDERAHRQVMIVRQSSISSAVNFLGPMPPKADWASHTELVVETAKRFEKYVMGQTVHEMIDDLPN